MKDDTDKSVQTEMVESGPNQGHLFRTSDIAHAAALQSSGCELLRIGSRSERNNRGHYIKKTEFVFDGLKAHETLVKFSNHQLNVDARTLIDNYRNLKAMSFGKGIAK